MITNVLSAESPTNTAIVSESPPDNNLPNTAPIKSPNPVIKEQYEIVESMATFTMVQVLKSQKYYHQALSVLDVLKSNGRDSDQISKEKNDIQQLLKNSI